MIDFVDATDLSNVEKAIKPETRMVWIETPTNPTLKVVDIAGVAAIVKKTSDCFLVVDNTFMTPYFQRPLTLGADMVVHSCTKYLNGHSDVIMGLVALSSDDLHKRLRPLQNNIGGVPSPFDCYLVNRYFLFGVKFCQYENFSSHPTSGIPDSRVYPRPTHRGLQHGL